MNNSTFIFLYCILVIVAQEMAVEGDIENAIKLIAGDPIFYYIRVSILFSIKSDKSLRNKAASAP